MIRPEDGDYPPSLGNYVRLVPESDVLSVLDAQLQEVHRLTAVVPAGRETFAYDKGKWTIREVVGHLGDAERVFGFRAFSFSRSDSSPLPGFDENDYVVQARFNLVSLVSLVDDFARSRQLNLSMFHRLRDAQWASSGTANNHRVTVRALAFGMAGHVRHHLTLLRERYGVEVEQR